MQTVKTCGSGGVPAALFLVLFGCGGSGGSSPASPSATPIPELLSSAGLYASIAAKQVDPRNRPYRPQYTLWSDGGVKRRWISLPAGARIDTTDMDRWVFPAGTKLWKEFSFQGRRVETRLIEKVEPAAGLASWRFKAFQWRGDESDAVLAPPEGVANVAATGLGPMHDIPSHTNCLDCHDRGGDGILGFEVLQLSADVDPLSNQEGGAEPGSLNLDGLVREGLLTVSPGIQPRLASSTPVGRWALGYLHANCGNCHNPQGRGRALGMFLRHTVGARSERDEPAYQTAVNQLNVLYAVEGTRVGLDSFRILGGAPDRSAVLIRMRNRGNFHAMPNIATKVPDTEAAGLVSEWIARLPPR